MGKELENFAMQQGGGIINAGMGLLLGNINDKRQLKQQGKLLRQQVEHQKEMNTFQKGLDLQMWKDTSYPAQMEMMQKAGLNPALLYGTSGGGGTTTGGGGSSVNGGTAQQNPGEAQAGMSMGLQLALMQAQTEKIKAETENVQTDTEIKGGVGKEKIQTEIASLTQGIENAKAQEELTKIQTSISMIEEDIKGATQNAAKALVMQELRSSYERMEMIKNEKLISDATLDEKIKLIEQELIGSYVQNELTKAQTGLTAEQAKKWSAEIAQGWANLNRQEYEVALKKWEAEIKAQFPSITQTMGKTWNDLVEGLKSLMDGKDAHKNRTYDAPKRK